MEKKCQKYNIIQMLKSTLFSHIFQKKFLSKFTLKNIYNTPQICSDMLKIAPKALHFLKKNGTPPPSQERPTAPPTPPPFRTFPAASHLVYYSTQK